MLSFSRRDLLKATLALPAILSPSSAVFSQRTPRIRYSAASAQGKEMIALYARAVGAMKEQSNDHRSWMFQWYTHQVPEDQTSKNAALERIFGRGRSPAKLLAEAMWSTCQAHGEDQNARPTDFLPWHRAYLYYFEDIIRSVLGNEDFTLPYWDYITDDVLPEEFRAEGDADLGPLYIAQRNEGINDGMSLSELSGRPMNSLPELLQRSYEPIDSVDIGFCEAINRNLHDAIHVMIGNDQNMGSVGFSAGDPIFWLHHCNIDRLWAAWNRLGNQNPTRKTWTDRKHVFADREGNMISVRNGQLNSIEALSYEYETYPEGPAIAPSALTGNGSPATLATTSSATRLNVSRPLEAKLERSLPATGSPTLAALSGDNKRIFLSLSDLKTRAQPGVLFKVFAKPPVGADGEDGDTSKIELGIVNFFDASTKAERQGTRFVLDITPQLKGLRPDLDPAQLTIGIEPMGSANSSAEPSIGTLALLVK